MILVVGATGSLGGRIARGLLEQGKEVRVVVRPRSDGKALIDGGAEPIAADVKDRSSLDAAVHGVDTVITTANTARRAAPDTVEAVDDHGNRNLIDAAAAAGVGQFIFVSGLGADPSSPVPFIAAKGKAEEHLHASGLSFTILQPNAFMDVWLGMLVSMPLAEGRPIVLVGECQRKHSMIAEEDVRAFVLAAVDNPAAINRTLVLGGPEPISFLDAVAVYERALGRKLDVRHVKPGSPLAGVPDPVAALLAGLDAFDSPIQMDEMARTFDVKLTSLEQFVQESLQVSVRI